MYHCRVLWNFQTAWWRHQMETFSALLALCAGNSPVTGEFPALKWIFWTGGFSRDWILRWVSESFPICKQCPCSGCGTNMHTYKHTFTTMYMISYSNMISCQRIWIWLVELANFGCTEQTSHWSEESNAFNCMSLYGKTVYANSHVMRDVLLPTSFSFFLHIEEIILKYSSQDLYQHANEYLEWHIPHHQSRLLR